MSEPTAPCDNGLKPSAACHRAVIDITLVASTEKPGGMGEPATAPIGLAVANAMFAATGKRLREMPFTRSNIAPASIPAHKKGSAWPTPFCLRPKALPV